MVSNVSFKSLVKSLRLHEQHWPRIFLGYLIFHVAQFRESVSKYLELASQVYGHNAENIIEAKIRYSDEVEGHYLLERENLSLFL